MPETFGDRLVRGPKGAFLDGLGGFFGAIVGGFYRIPGTRPIKDLLHGTWILRHPLHPAVTDAVVGGYTAVAALDVVYLIQRDQALWKATDIALLVSLLFAAVAILSGYTDWNETYANEKRLGILHGTLMSLITIGYLVSLWLRVTGGPGAREGAIWLALILWVLVAVTAHLGGEMAFGFGTGVDRQAWADVPSKWQKLALAATALEDGKPVRVELGTGFAVMLAKVGGAIHAIGDVCTHAGCALHEGTLSGTEITCPCHGSVFSLRNGAALHGPATMDEPAFETRVSAEGTIEVKARA